MNSELPAAETDIAPHAARVPEAPVDPFLTEEGQALLREMNDFLEECGIVSETARERAKKILEAAFALKQESLDAIHELQFSVAAFEKRMPEFESLIAEYRKKIETLEKAPKKATKPSQPKRPPVTSNGSANGVVSVPAAPAAQKTTEPVSPAEMTEAQRLARIAEIKKKLNLSS